MFGFGVPESLYSCKDDLVTGTGSWLGHSAPILRRQRMKVKWGLAVKPPGSFPQGSLPPVRLNPPHPQGSRNSCTNSRKPSVQTRESAEIISYSRHSSVALPSSGVLCTLPRWKLALCEGWGWKGLRRGGTTSLWAPWLCKRWLH